MAAPNLPGSPPSTPVQDLTRTVQNLKDFTSAVTDATSQVSNLATLALNAAKAVIESAEFKSLTGLTEAFKARIQAQEDFDRQTMMTSALLERVTGMNALARKDVMTALGPESLLSKASADTFKAVNDYGEATIKFLNGTEVRALAVFGDINELFETFNASVLDDTRLTVAAQRGITYDLVENTRLAAKQLGLTQADINEIFQKELSETGKISGQGLKDFEKTALMTAQSTGMSVTLITKDLAKMTGDFSHFGMMTTDQMGSLSANIHQLGLDISDVTRLSDNFSSFDKAAATMSNLAASTGATLDTLELFRLANTDQEEFIRSLRTQLEDQGVEFENLNFIQQKQIASSFGLDPRVAQRLLSDNLDMVSNITGEISAAKDKTSDEDLRKTLASLGSLREEAMKVDTTALAARYSSLKTASADVAESLEKVYANTLQFADVGVSKFGGGLDAMAAKAHELRTTLLDLSKATTSNLIQSDPDLIKKYESFGKESASSFAVGLSSMKDVVAQIATGMADTFVSRVKAGMEHVTGKSPSPLGRSITDGLASAFKEFDDKKIATKFGGTLGDDIKKSLASKREEITSTIPEIGRVIEAEVTVATLEGGDTNRVNKLIADRYKDILTADQVVKMRAGEDGVAAVVTELYDAQIKKMATPTASPETTQSGQASTATGQATKIEVAPQEIKIHITLSGGDALTQALADSVIGRAIGEGIEVTGHAGNVKLATVSPA